MTSDQSVIVKLMGPNEVEDYRRLRLFALLANPEGFGTVYDDEVARPLHEFEDRLKSQFVFGAYLGGKVVGIAGLARDPGSKVRHKGTLRGFFVDPAARGKGVGRKLLEGVLRYADGVVEQVALTVATQNLSAIALYEALGFQRYGLERRALKVSSGYDDQLLMVRYRDLGVQ